MTVPNIHNEPCDCPKGQCAHFVDNDADCINRLPDASVMACKDCGSMSWHSKGKCQRCSWLASKQQAPARIQRKRTKGWRMPENTISVTRPGKWGNPYRPNSWNERGFAPVPDNAAMAVRWYREDLIKVLRANPDALTDLRGKNLACWCQTGQPCHGDVLLEFANQTPPSPIEIAESETP